MNINDYVLNHILSYLYRQTTTQTGDWSTYTYFSNNAGDELTFSYRYYLNWESRNGLEATLPGFLLTNRQMFWLSLRQSKCFKSQVGNSDQNDADYYISEYPEFSEAYKCNRESVNIEV